MEDASKGLLQLEPVTFRYTEDLDPDGGPQFGLIAEQVEKVNPELVVRDEEGKVMTVRYDAVNAMLLNEFLKEHRKVEEQQATIAALQLAATKEQEIVERLRATAERQEKEAQSFRNVLQTQAALIEKVSRASEMRRSAPSTVVTNP
jgi:hypothetical protein